MLENVRKMRMNVHRNQRFNQGNYFQPFDIVRCVYFANVDITNREEKEEEEERFKHFYSSWLTSWSLFETLK